MTNVKVKKHGDTKRELTITVPKENLDTYFKKAYQKVGAKAKIPGFRPGKIPAQVLDKHHGPEVDYECLNYLVDDSYKTALQTENLVPILQPKFDVKPLLRGVDYEYKVEIEVKPDFKLKEYKGLKLKDKTPKVEPKEVEQELDLVRERFAESEPAADTDTLQEGCVATIDFVGSIDGTEFPGGTAKDYALNFGKGMFLKEFEEQIAGMKKGDERDIKVPFPKDYFEKSLAGKTADFKVTLKNLHKKKLPPLDDELAKDMGKATLDELKKDIEAHIARVKLQQVKPEYIKEIRAKFKKDYKFGVPEPLLDIQVEEQEKALKQNPKLNKLSRDELEELVRFDFVLEAIAIAEKVQPTPQEVHQTLVQYAQAYKKPLAEIQQAMQENGMLMQIISRMTLDKTIDFLIENAKLS